MPFFERPRIFLNYVLVSKLWYQVMVSILWRTCLHARLTAVPVGTLERFLPHIRFLEAYASAPLIILRCTKLLELTFAMRILPGLSLAQSLSRYKSFVDNNPGLRALSWDGMIDKVKSTLDPNDFARLRRLESLALFRWRGSEGDLARILRPVAGSLTTLKLHHLTGINEANLIAVDQYGSSNDMDNEYNANNISSNSSKLSVDPHCRKLLGASLCFPVLKNLSFELSSGIQLDFLLRCCPNLEYLDFYISETNDINSTAQIIRSSCPKLRFLNARSEMSPLRGLALMRNYPSTPGLQHLKLALGRSEREIGLEILSLSRTLKYVDLTIRYCEGLTAGLIAGLLRTCEQLEYLEVGVQTYKGNDFLQDLASQPWICRRLRSLHLRVMPLSTSYSIVPIRRLLLAVGEASFFDVSDHRREEERKEECRDIMALKSISSTTPAMGWLRSLGWHPDGQPDRLRRLLKMIERFGMDDLMTVGWNYCVYKRAPRQS